MFNRFGIDIFRGSRILLVMQRLSKTFLISFIIWTLLGLFWASRLYYSYNFNEPTVPLAQILYWGLADWYIWGLMSPLVMWLVNFAPFSRGQWLRSTLIHLPASVLGAAIQLALFSVVYIFVGGLDYTFQSYTNPSYGLVYEGMLIGKFHSSVIVYWGITFVSNAITNYRRFTEEKIRTREIQSKLAQAELSALRMQLNPHFLFNALNTISTLMHEDVELADRMLVRLSELLRTVLKKNAELETPLSTELAFIRKYLEIEEARFGERLKVYYDIDIESKDALVPAYILQPLVENAVKHGVALLDKGGEISIQSIIKNDRLHLMVQNVSPAKLQIDSQNQSGVGLSNIKERLNQLYGKDHGFEVSMSENKFTVTIDIPYQKTNKS